MSETVNPIIATRCTARALQSRNANSVSHHRGTTIHPEAVSTNRGVSALAVALPSGRQAEQARPPSANAATPNAAPDARPRIRATAMSTGKARKITSGGTLVEITATSRRPTVTAAQNTARARLAVASARARTGAEQRTQGNDGGFTAFWEEAGRMGIDRRECGAEAGYEQS